MDRDLMTPEEQEEILARILSGNGSADQLGFTPMTPKEHAAALQGTEPAPSARQKAEELWGNLESEALAGMSKLAEEYLQETAPEACDEETG